ncbi:MAG TPA: lysophospholipid acyltransferase family protein [Gammaproteobacteria bacterium]
MLLRRLYEYFVLYAGLILFAVICLVWSLLATLLGPILPERIGAPLGQFAIMAGFRLYLDILRLSGIVKLDLSALDVLRDEQALIIAPNHPSMIDVVLIASRLPRLVCIMKASIWDNLLLGGGARLAGYIRNDAPVNMVRLAAEAVRKGTPLLIFPEGTRTVTPPVNEFKAGYGLIAKKAGAPIQSVFIDTNCRFLGKGWPLFKLPEFPLHYRVVLGKRFEAAEDVKSLIGEMESYYRQHPSIQNLFRETTPQP